MGKGQTFCIKQKQRFSFAASHSPLTRAPEGRRGPRASAASMQIRCGRLPAPEPSTACGTEEVSRDEDDMFT